MDGICRPGWLPYTGQSKYCTSCLPPVLAHLNLEQCYLDLEAHLMTCVLLWSYSVLCPHYGIFDVPNWFCKFAFPYIWWHFSSQLDEVDLNRAPWSNTPCMLYMYILWLFSIHILYTHSEHTISLQCSVAKSQYVDVTCSPFICRVPSKGTVRQLTGQSLANRCWSSVRLFSLSTAPTLCLWRHTTDVFHTNPAEVIGNWPWTMFQGHGLQEPVYPQ